MSKPEFTIFFDGDCPFCVREVQWLRRRDKRNAIGLVDIAAPEFDESTYGVSRETMMRQLHGMKADGTMTVGMESFRQVYRAVGLGWLLAPTAWPGLRQLFDWLYSIFARYRVRLGRAFGRTCDDGQCRMS